MEILRTLRELEASGKVISKKINTHDSNGTLIFWTDDKTKILSLLENVDRNKDKLVFKFLLVNGPSTKTNISLLTSLSLKDVDQVLLRLQEREEICSFPEKIANNRVITLWKANNS